MPPPCAEVRPYSHKYHGAEYKDNYHWLRSDKRDDPDVIKYVNSENEYAKFQMAPLDPLVDTLFQECLDRVVEDDQSVPYKQGDYWYYNVSKKGLQYPVRMRKYKSLEAVEGTPMQR